MFSFVRPARQNHSGGVRKGNGKPQNLSKKETCERFEG
jgi:hypothetical protein